MNKKLYYYFLIFTISGFAGLIYESIWSRYLKMFLGHASYAQMMVLIIFMGGMAIGSALAAKYSPKLKNLILGYAIAELIIGLLGVTFHGIFTSAMEFTFGLLIPALDSPQLITASKFLISSVIILPQSILLGATFPLITAGLVRQNPENTGSSIAKLYFFNSIGAAAGVLCNAFVIIPNLGLPGAVLTAGAINILLAIVVYRLSKNDTNTVAKSKVYEEDNQTSEFSFNSGTKLLLLVALVTGVASFMYEIAWIRMLSMVLGASTDAFEIMLSAFILGLAIGSWVIRNRVNQLKDAVRTLALIQILMAILAALTIPFYDFTFDLMAATKGTLKPTDIGYNVYNVICFSICIFVMLPTTICAGTTLPLITNVLLNREKSESSVGWVYSFNTVGAILGVLISVQIVLPMFGLKPLILLGASLDLVMGVVLLATLGAKWKFRVLMPASILGVAVILGVGVLSQLDSARMSSGVFRYGFASSPDSKVLFSEHGKTSSIAIREYGDGSRVITTNGKPDAGAYPNYDDNDGRYGPDEPTMILLGLLPFVHNPKATEVANIGFGSGLTSEAVLSNARVESLDTVEIEEKIVKAAKFFSPKVLRPFNDVRSNIVIDDAKTFFVSNAKQYDVIIAEPSNPWVSGVSSLFSREFYSLIQNHLNTDGVYVQWIQAYEINPALVASIYNAIRDVFPNVILYSIANSDMAFVVSKKEPHIDYNYFSQEPDSLKMLEYINSSGEDNFRSKRVADQRLLDHLFTNYSAGINSDFFPILDNGAPKARYKESDSTLVLELLTAKIAKQITSDDYIYSEANANVSVDTENTYKDYGRRYNVLKNTLKLLSKHLEIKSIDFEKVQSFGFEEKNLALQLNSLFNACVDTSEDFTRELVRWFEQNYYLINNIKSLEFLDRVKNTCFVADNGEISSRLAAISAFLTKNYEASLHEAVKYFEVRTSADNVSTVMLKILMASMHQSNSIDILRKYKKHIPETRLISKDPELMVLNKMLETMYYRGSQQPSFK